MSRSISNDPATVPENATPTVRFEQVDAVGHIILCDPPDNRIGRRFADDLQCAVHQASSARTRVVLVRAEGPNFGTGGDVARWPGKTVDWFHTFISEVNQAYKAIENLRVPTIAAVRGKAVGGHFELILHCDLIIAAESASFHATETQTGMVPLAGGLQRLAERIGRGRTIDLVFLSQPLNGDAAKDIGLATQVVAEADVEDVASALAQRLAAGPTMAYGTARALLKSWSSGGVAGADDVQMDLTMRLFDTTDAQQAFLSLKRAIESGGDKSQSEAASTVSFIGN